MHIKAALAGVVREMGGPMRANFVVTVFVEANRSKTWSCVLMPTSTPAAASMAQAPPQADTFRADEGPLGVLQTDLRDLSYKLLELSILATETTDDTQPEPRVAAKMLVSLAHSVRRQEADAEALH